MKHNIVKILLLIIIPRLIYATAYVYPGTANVPFNQFTNSGDSLTIQDNSTMQTTDNTGYTVQLPVGLTNLSININEGSKLSYAGTNTNASTVYANISGVTSAVINVNGTLASGIAQNAVYVENTSGSNVGEYRIYVNNNVTGDLQVLNVLKVFIFAENDALIFGDVNFVGTESYLQVGNNASTTYTTQGTLGQLIRVYTHNSSILNINHDASLFSLQTQDQSLVHINAPTSIKNGPHIADQSSLRISSSLSGIANDITIDSGANLIIDRTATIAAVSPRTLNCNGTYITEIYSNSIAGDLTLTNYNNVPINNFKVEYTGGLLQSGTFTLISAPASATITPSGTISKPDDSIFFRFGDIQGFGTNSIRITVDANSFSSLDQDALNVDILNAIQSLQDDNFSSDVAFLTSTITSAPTTADLTTRLNRLRPLTSPALYTMAIGNINISQVELRIASTKQNYYNAGDDSRLYVKGLQNGSVWFRPYAAYAKQSATQDILGYKATTAGIAVGYDYENSKQDLLGVAFTYANSYINDQVVDGSKTVANSYQAMIYGNTRYSKKFYQDWIISVYINNFNTRRSIYGYPSTANSKYTNPNLAAKTFFGYTFNVSDRVLLSPEVSALYMYSKHYEYTESNAGAANLTVNENDANLLQFGAGARFDAAFNRRFFGNLHVIGLYNAVNNAYNSLFNFATGFTELSSNFVPPRFSYTGGVAISILPRSNFRIYASLDLLKRTDYIGYAAYIDFRYKL